MAAAADKKESVALSLFMEVNDLEVEEGLSTLATLLCAGEGVEKNICWHLSGRSGTPCCLREHVVVDIRVVCPQDEEKICEELKEGVCLEPIQAMLQRKTNASRTYKHSNVMRKLVVEGGWVQKR